MEDEIVEEEYGFRKGRSCTDTIFTVQQIIGNRKEHDLPLFLLFIDYEKAYDSVNTDKLWEMMDNKIPNYLLNTIKCIYRNTKVRFNPLKPELNPICYLLALLAHHFLHVSRIRVKSLTIRLLMSYIYGAPILDVSRSHTTTHHSR